MTATGLQTLLLSDMVGSTRLTRELGDLNAASVFEFHDHEARKLMVRFNGQELEKTDGFLLLFGNPEEAVEFAACYHDLMTKITNQYDIELSSRVGIHLVLLPFPQKNPDGTFKGPLVEKGQKKTLEVLMGMAGSGQSLLTRPVFDLINLNQTWPDGMEWKHHGSWELAPGRPAFEIYESGYPSKAPFTKPGAPKLENANWKPKSGSSLPDLTHWKLLECISTTPVSNIQSWLAHHDKTGEKRLFKLGLNAEACTVLKREVAVFRLLRQELGKREDLSPILDWNFDSLPFRIEYAYPEQGTLEEWCQVESNLATMSIPGRIELIAQVAEALDSAHSIGVIHKGIHPRHIWMKRKTDGTPRCVLTGFDAHSLQDPSRLEQSGITTIGLDLRSLVMEEAPPPELDPYLAPERLTGSPATIQGDIYSVGVLLFQLLTGDIHRTPAHGWQGDIGNPILIEIISQAIQGHPDQRFSRAFELAQRLRDFEGDQKKYIEREKAIEEEQAKKEKEIQKTTQQIHYYKKMARIGWGVAAVVCALWIIQLIFSLL